jgi:hypothetical protein
MFSRKFLHDELVGQHDHLRGGPGHAHLLPGLPHLGSAGGQEGPHQGEMISVSFNIGLEKLIGRSLTR